jgi:hypothetical protein
VAVPIDPEAARAGGVFSDNPSYRGSWVVYINGIEVPCIGWQVDYGVWEIPQATIHMFPEKVLERLGSEDRVQVAIFYLDHWASTKSTYRLMFDGEIIGWSYSNFASQRTISFDCLAHIHIFQQLYFFFMNSIDNIVNAGDQVTSSTSITTAGFSYPFQLFHQGIIGAPLTTGGNGQPGGPATAGVTPAPGGQPVPGGPSQPDTGTSPGGFIQRPLDFVYNVVAGLISSQVPPGNRTAAMVNFFARHVRKTRFYNRWVALPLLEDQENIVVGQGAFPIFRAAASEAALTALQRNTENRAAGAGPVWNTIQQTLATVFMEVGMLPTAPCVRTEILTGRILGELRTTDPISEQHEAALQLQVEQDLQAQTATQVQDVDFHLNDSGNLTEIRSANASDTTLNQALSFNSQTGQTDSTSTSSNIPASAAQTAAGSSATRAQSQQGISPTTPVRLAQYFVKPQMYFGVAPRSNVFYPSMISGYNYSENYIQQPTRVYVNDALLQQALQATGSNASMILQALTVGWPEEADSVLRAARGTSPGGAPTSTQGQIQSGKDILLYPEELYKGPVVERMTMPAWFTLLVHMRNSESTPASVAGTATAPTIQTSASFANSQASTPTPGTIQGRPIPTDAAAQRNPRGTIYASPPPGTSTAYVFVPSGGHLQLPGTTSYGYRLGYGTGLDPTNYISPPAFCFLSPQDDFTSRTLNNQTSRVAAAVRQLQTSSQAGLAHAAPTNITQFQSEVRRYARLTNFIMEGLSAIPKINNANLTPVQLKAVAFAVAVTFFNESSSCTRISNWNFANAVHRAEANPSAKWTVHLASDNAQTPPNWRAIQAFESPQEARTAQLNIIFNQHRFSDAVKILLGQERMGTSGILAPLQPLVNAIRPSWAATEQSLGIYISEFYIALCYAGWVSGRQNDLASATTDPAKNQPDYYAPVIAALPNYPAITSTIPITDLPALYDPQYASLIRPAGAAIHNRLRISSVATGAPVTLSSSPVPQPATGAPPNANTTGGTTTAPAPASTGTASGTPTQSPPGATGPGARTQTPTIAAPTANADNNGPFSDLFRLFAQYEFFRSRYDKRRAVLTLAFNPYPVPGFPAVIFDKITTEHHAVGYVVHVTQSASAQGSGSMSTTVQLSYCRTMNEWIYNIATDTERTGAAVASAPAEVIPQIRSAIQDRDNAETFYRRLFYGGYEPPFGASFDILSDIGWVDDNGDIQLFTQNAIPVAQEVDIENRIQAALGAQANNETSPDISDIPDTLNVSHNLDPNRRIVVAPKFYQAVDKYDVAMKLAARPICTLAQYIRFWHGGRPINDLIADQSIGAATDNFSYQTTNDQDIVVGDSDSGPAQVRRGSAQNRTTADYYDYIYKLRQGPGLPPDDNALHYNFSATQNNPTAATATATIESVDPSYPQTRADWESVLKYYRNVVRGRDNRGRQTNGAPRQ